MMPPIPYYGSKGMLGPHIAAMMPAHSHYVEAFAGSLAVLFAKPRSPLETVNDADLQLITFYRVLRNRTDELMKVCELTPYSRYELEHATVDEPGLDELETARRVFVKLTQGRAGRMNQTGWRYHKKYTGEGRIYMERFLDRLAPAAARLEKVQIECMDAIDLIDQYGQDADTLIYCDPPYLSETRNVSHSTGAYRHELLTADDHIRLAKALHDCRAGVLLSGYSRSIGKDGQPRESTLYEQLYEDWHVVEFPTSTAQGGERKSTVEVVWTNRVPRNGLQVTLWDGLAAAD